MSNQLRPNDAERAFLNLAYNRFYDLYDEVMDDSFWQKDEWYRFSRVANGFSVYAELLNYQPIKWVIEHLRQARPPMEAEIGSELFRFIRNVITHFPFFDSWNEVWISKQLVNWDREGQSIDQFLQKYAGHEGVKYRIWEGQRKRMTYLRISFPPVYDDSKIYLRDIMSEQEGVKFSFALMKRIADTQVEHQ